MNNYIKAFKDNRQTTCQEELEMIISIIDREVEYTGGGIVLDWLGCCDFDKRLSMNLGRKFIKKKTFSTDQIDGLQLLSDKFTYFSQFLKNGSLDQCKSLLEMIQKNYFVHFKFCWMGNDICAEKFNTLVINDFYSLLTNFRLAKIEKTIPVFLIDYPVLDSKKLLKIIEDEHMKEKPCFRYIIFDTTNYFETQKLFPEYENSFFNTVEIKELAA
jgi:hypothetical protein